MAGTLTVQNLQGPSSGSDANKVIIPSGQTLDVSAGTFTPSAGQVVQVKKTYANPFGAIESTSSSLVASGIQVVITPKFSDSLLFIDFVSTMVHANTNGTAIKGRMYANGSSIGAQQYNLGYQAYSENQYSPFAFSMSYAHGTTSAITLEPYFQSVVSGSNVRLVHPQASYALTVWEIAQ